MIGPGTGVRVYLACGATDMRKGIGGLAALGFGGRLGPSPEPVPLVRAQLGLPEHVSFNLDPTSPGPVAVSPDGRHVAYTGIDSSGTVMLYVHTLAEASSRSIPGTAGAVYPFWSPDSRELAFFRDNDLSRVDIAGGPVVAIATATNGKGGSWSTEDRILFAPTHIASIYEVPLDEVAVVVTLTADPAPLLPGHIERVAWPLPDPDSAPPRDDGAPWRNFYGRRKGKQLRPGQIAHMEQTLPRLPATPGWATG